MITARGLLQTFHTRVGREKREVRAVDGVDLDVAASGVMWGTAWAFALFALAVWWGTATFRKENA